jgi:hypothetical protein
MAEVGVDEPLPPDDGMPYDREREEATGVVMALCLRDRALVWVDRAF